ncbi:MAG: ExbD/TolR family protein [Salibacteraceae bacterium]
MFQKKYSRSEKEPQENATSSLPDIVFMLLFFFMVATVMKENEPLVKISPPEASESKKLEDRSLVRHIFIGPPQNRVLGDQPRLQLNDAFASINDVRPYIEEQRPQMPEVLQEKMIVSLKVDQATQMQMVTDVKQELKKASARKINYASTPGNDRP